MSAPARTVRYSSVDYCTSEEEFGLHRCTQEPLFQIHTLYSSGRFEIYDNQYQRENCPSSWYFLDLSVWTQMKRKIFLWIIHSLKISWNLEFNTVSFWCRYYCEELSPRRNNLTNFFREEYTLLLFLLPTGQLDHSLFFGEPSCPKQSCWKSSSIGFFNTNPLWCTILESETVIKRKFLWEK